MAQEDCEVSMRVREEGHWNAIALRGSYVVDGVVKLVALRLNAAGVGDGGFNVGRSHGREGRGAGGEICVECDESAMLDVGRR